MSKFNMTAKSVDDIRIGIVALVCREQLYALTVMEIERLTESDDATLVNISLENAVKNNLQMAALVCRAGGCWLYDGKALVFTPGLPPQSNKLAYCYSSDKNESVMQNELTENKSVYTTWSEIQKRCVNLEIM